MINCKKEGQAVLKSTNHSCRWFETYSDSRAYCNAGNSKTGECMKRGIKYVYGIRNTWRLREINRLEFSFAQGGRVTSSISSPLIFLPKLNLFLFSKNSGKKLFVGGREIFSLFAVTRQPSEEGKEVHGFQFTYKNSGISSRTSARLRSPDPPEADSLCNNNNTLILIL